MNLDQPSIGDDPDLDRLITTLKSSLESGQGLVKYFKYPRALYSALIQISKLVGLSNVKTMVARMIKSHVVNLHDLDSPSDSQVMNHILLVGPPGTGKTTTAQLLAKVICAIGFLESDQPDPNEPNSPSNSTNILEVLSRVHRGSVKGLTQENTVLKRQAKMTRGICQDMQDSLDALSELITQVAQNTKDGSLDSAIKLLETFGELNQEILDLNQVEQTTDQSVDQSVEDDFQEKIVVASRDMLVAGYVGQTAIKVKKRINEALGGVLFIDEAYNLFNKGSSGGSESFSQEAINTIVGYMSKYNNRLVIIMAGYKEETLQMLKSNQGMARRFGHIITIDEYSTEEVARILTNQLEQVSLRLDPTIEVEKIFSQYKVAANGGLTNQLVLILKSIYSEVRYQEITTGQATSQATGLVTKGMLEAGIAKLREQTEIIDSDDLPPLMYC